MGCRVSRKRRVWTLYVKRDTWAAESRSGYAGRLYKRQCDWLFGSRSDRRATKKHWEDLCCGMRIGVSCRSCRKICDGKSGRYSGRSGSRIWIPLSQPDSCAEFGVDRRITVRRDGRQSCRLASCKRERNSGYRDRQCSRLKHCKRKRSCLIHICRPRDLGCDDKGVQRTVGGNVPSRRTDGKSKRQNRWETAWRIARGTVQNSR